MSYRVLMFGWEYAPYFTGGLGVVTRAIIKSLVSQGQDVVFVLPKMPLELNDTLTKVINASKIKISTEDTEIYSKIELLSKLMPYISVKSPRPSQNSYIKNNNYSSLDSFDITDEIYGEDLFAEVERYANQAIEIAKANPHDIIHTHDWMTAKAGIMAQKYSHAPHLLHIHATEFDRTGGNPNQSVYDIEREGLEKSDMVIAVSEYTKNSIIKNYGIPANKIKVVYNAIELNKNANKLPKKIFHNDKVILFLGRLTLQKGAEYLLEAAPKVVKLIPNVKFVFIGQGEMLEQLIQKSIDLGVDKYVMFAGFLDHEEVDKAYQMADVFIMPSTSEPFGITALEAIRNGTPVIISKQSGVSEVILNALKVDFWDTDELTNLIYAVLSHKSLSKLLTEHALVELRKLNWNSQVNKIVKIYETAINK